MTSVIVMFKATWNIYCIFFILVSNGLYIPFWKLYINQLLRCKYFVKLSFLSFYKVLKNVYAILSYREWLKAHLYTQYNKVDKVEIYKCILNSARQKGDRKLWTVWNQGIYLKYSSTEQEMIFPTYFVLPHCDKVIK